MADIFSLVLTKFCMHFIIQGLIQIHCRLSISTPKSLIDAQCSSQMLIIHLAHTVDVTYPNTCEHATTRARTRATPVMNVENYEGTIT